MKKAQATLLVSSILTVAFLVWINATSGDSFAQGWLNSEREQSELDPPLDSILDKPLGCTQRTEAVIEKEAVPAPTEQPDRRISISDMSLPVSHGAKAEILGEDCVIAWKGNTRSISYASGELLSIGVFVQGRREGVHQDFHKNGMLRAVYSYENGKAHGDWLSYGQSGNLLRSVHYEMGVKNGPKVEYFKNGKVEHIGEMRDGRRHGHWDYYRDTGEPDWEATGLYENDSLVDGEK